MRRERAVEIGQEAIIWIAGSPDVLEGLIAATGLSPEMLRARVEDPVFLGFVLDHLLSSDTLVIDFAEAAGLDPEVPLAARIALAGDGARGWVEP